MESTEKVEYRGTTTNLPLCNDSIIVLKIRPLHSISVITNFIILKRDKQNNTITTILGMVIEQVRPIFAPPNFFDPISSFATRGH